MDYGAIFAGFSTLVSEGFPLILKLFTEREEKHAEIITELQSKVATYSTTLSSFAQNIDKNDLEINDEITKVEGPPKA